MEETYLFDTDDEFVEIFGGKDKTYPEEQYAKDLGQAKAQALLGNQPFDENKFREQWEKDYKTDKTDKAWGTATNIFENVMQGVKDWQQGSTSGGQAVPPSTIGSSSLPDAPPPAGGNGLNGGKGWKTWEIAGVGLLGLGAMIGLILLIRGRGGNK